MASYEYRIIVRTPGIPERHIDHVPTESTPYARVTATLGAAHCRKTGAYPTGTTLKIERCKEGGRHRAPHGPLTWHDDRITETP